MFTPGRPAHNHSPGHWAAVQAQAWKDCDPVAWIECICSKFAPEVVVAMVLAIEMDDKPLAKKHLTHYLTGGGKEFNEDTNLEKLIKTDPTVREKLLGEIAKSTTGNVFIQQSDYTDQDFRFAFGGIDRMEWEVDAAAGSVDIWFQDRYDFHPVGFGYTKFSDGADIVRPTNCVHAAAVELKPGAADYWMKGQATFPLSKSKGSTSGGSSSDDL